MKALRRGFIDTFGFEPPKTRRYIEVEKPRNWLVGLWWKLTRRQPRKFERMMPSTWRRWKKLAKAADRGE